MGTRLMTRAVSDSLRRFLSVVVLVALGCASALPASAQTGNAQEIVAASIARHDPEGVWRTGSFQLTFEESRPDGPTRNTLVVIDNARGRFEFERERDGRRMKGELDSEGCLWRLDGVADFSAEEREEFGLTCERLEVWRNYYLYLWGMPMKLREAGIHIEQQAKKAEFVGRSAWEVRVTFPEEAGSDVWYFYFDPEDEELIGYRFYHDEAANDGEYITFEGIEEGAGLRLPRSRAWTTHQDGNYLGTDSLVAIEAVD